MARASQRLQQWLSGSRTPGIHYMAVDAAQVRFEFHGGSADLAHARAMEAGTTMMAYSMSKTFTAAGVLKLAEAGRLDLEAPVAALLPELPWREPISARQLLCHSAGVPNPIPLRWVHTPAQHASFDEAAALAAVLQAHPRLASPPGTRFAYSNIGYWLLGVLIERVTGERFTAWMERELLAPIGSDARYAIADPLRHATGYLERGTLLGLAAPLLIDRALLGASSGRWRAIHSHHVNSASFGGLIGTAAGFAKLLQDQLAAHSRVLGDRGRAWFYEPQHARDGRALPMTLGWHMGRLASHAHFYKEGGGGGFHCLMRLYLDRGAGSLVMTNATAFDVHAALDALDPEFLG